MDSFLFVVLQVLVVLYSCDRHGNVAYADDDTGLTGRELCKPGVTPSPIRVDTSARVAALRKLMVQHSLSAYIIPSGDAHQTEYVSSHDKRRTFITGFTGSSGTAAVSKTKTALWTDSRYYIQADEEMDCNWALMKASHSPPSIQQWLVNQGLKSGDKVGVDPRLMSVNTYQKHDKKFVANNITLVPLMTNLIDQIWTEGRPPIKRSHLLILDLKYAGKSWEDKLVDVRSKMKSKGADAVVLPALDDIAWLYNLRGTDVPYTPIFYSYTIVTKDKAYLYLQDKDYKATPELKAYLSSPEKVEILDYDQFFTDLEKLDKKAEIKKIWVGKTKSDYAIYKTVSEEKRLLQFLPVDFMKTLKNEVERKGMRNAHLKDAVAKVDFFAFLEKEMAAGKYWTEMSAAAKIEEFRSQQEDFKGPGFATISGAGPNAAKPHYIPTNHTDRQITTNEVYLLDSGGQYLDGTTDVTRTVHFGTPTEFEKEVYTRVLMGSINLASWVWRYGKHGYSLSSAARSALWDVGLDYFHGTGHGVGMYSVIHEGAANFQHGCYEGYADQVFDVGIFISDEPGYYEAGKFGVRLETMLEVVAAKPKYTRLNRRFLKLQVVSLVPFEPKMIKLELLTRKQRIWLNEFNRQCLVKVGAELVRQRRLDGYKWLVERTKPVSLDVNAARDGGASLIITLVSLLAGMIFMNRR